MKTQAPTGLRLPSIFGIPAEFNGLSSATMTIFWHIATSMRTVILKPKI
jgi:hypothetical protein